MGDLLFSESAHAIDCIGRYAVGKRLEAVRYRALRWTFNLNKSVADVDEADDGVEFTFDGTSILLEWDTKGDHEWISAAQARLAEPSDDTIEVIDASARTGWIPRVGDQVTGLGIALYRPTASLGACAWSIRLDFAVAPSVCIALGRIESDAIEYQPDSLVVIFEEDTARAYCFDGSLSSAWGTDWNRN
jgi:hypothetical protein